MTEEEAVKSALTKERVEGEYLLSKFHKKIQQFEEEYSMSTEDFIERYEAGELGDKEEYMEWKALHESIEHWQNKIKKLEKAC